MKQLNNESMKLQLNPNIYPQEAIIGVSYIFIDKAYTFLDKSGSNKIDVYLKSKERASKKQKQELKGEFMNELLNYVLRINIAKRNKKAREYIVERALFSAAKPWK